MVHLLIDTCSLLTMANSYGYNYYIKKLKNYINEGDVKLYVHKLGLEEWEKNFPDDFDRKVTKLRRRAENPDLITKDHLEAQYAAISDLLVNAETLNTPGKIEDQTFDRLRRRIAPFHNKLDSVNDWIIIGSFAHHCVREGIPKMYFVSKNSNEFCNVPISDQDDDSNARLHEDIVNAFESLQICYFVRFKTFMTKIAADIEDLKEPRKSYKRKIEWGVTSKKTVLESFDFLFNNIFSQVNYIPVDILIQFSPFTSSTTRRVYCRDGIVFGVDENVLNFFKNFKINEDYSIIIDNPGLFLDVENFYERIRSIIFRLWDNLLYGFSQGSTSEILYITPPNGILPDSRPAVLKLNYSESYEYLLSEGEVNLASAYNNFKFGNFAKAFRQYQIMADDARKEGIWFKYFTCLYNQKQVAKYLQSPLLNITEVIDDTEVNAVKEIDLYEVAFEHRGEFEYPIMLFVTSGEFFAESLELITDSFSKLNSKFISKTIPIWSQSSETVIIQSEFRKVEVFLESNFLLFNNYSNFKRLFEYVIDSLFIANTLHENYQGQIRELDDEWAEKLIKYGIRKSLVQSWIRYKRQPIRYRRIDFDGGDLLSLTTKVLMVNTSDASSRQGFSGLQSDFFGSNYQHSVENILVLFSIMDLTGAQINNFGEILSKALRSNKLLAKHWIFDAINDFLQVRTSSMKNEIVVSLFKVFSKNHFLFSEKLMLTIAERYQGKKRLSISKRALISLIDNNINIPGVTTFRRKLLLILLIKHVDTNQANFINQLIVDRVKQGSQFDNEIFSISVAMDIIESNADDLLHAFQSIIPRLDSIKSKDFAMNTRAKIVDDLLNLSFKLDYRLPDDISGPIRALDPYYDWLICMDSFDYSMFKFEWLDYYKTKYYRDRQSKSRELKDHFEEMLRNSPNQKLSEKYVSIFIKP